MIGKNGGVVRFTAVANLPSDCHNCAADTAYRAFCPDHRGNRPCAFCAGRGWRVKDTRWLSCNH